MHASLLRNILTIFLLLQASSAHAKTKTLISQEVTAKQHLYQVVIHSASSKPNSNGQGFCGSGQEITLEIFQKASKTSIFTKLIESCLESIELKDGQLGSENSTSLMNALKLESNTPLEIHWLSISGKSNVNGFIDLSSGKAVYSEK